MAIQPKLRPSMSVRDIVIIVECLNYRVEELVKAGQTNNPIILDILRLKVYCDSLLPKVDEAATLLAKYLEQNQHLVTGATDTGIPVKQDSIIQAAITSPLDNPDLTDDQKLDLLELRSDNERTEAENVWYLNVGTMIKMRRQFGAKTPVDTNDL